MHSTEWKVKEKWMGAVALDEAHRFARKRIRQVFALTDLLVQVIEWHLGHVVVVGPRARKKAEELVETAVLRAEMLRIPQVPFSDDSGGVSSVAKIVRQRLLFQRQPIFGLLARG